MSTKKKLLILLVIALLVAGWYGYKEYSRTNKDLASVKADIHLSDKELISAFEKNEKDANIKMLDKIIAVTGKVKEVQKDEKGYYTVVLGNEHNMSSVRCSMDSLHRDQASAIAAGSEVTMKGACTGFNADELLGSDVILNRCVVQNKN
jgi:hypothetical protein